MNIKLNLKVLNQMDEEFIRLEASLLNVKDEKTRELLFKELREYRLMCLKLKEFWERVLRKA